MTPDASERSFEGQWPELERRLRRTLSRKCVKPWLQDDIVQETGLRLLRMWDDVDPVRGPWALTLTIANNLLWDERNRRQKRELVGVVPEIADNHDVERAGLARLELGRIKRALMSMSPNYRSILLAEVGYSLPLEGNPRAVYMLRMRARQRLAQALGRGREALGALPLGWRKLNEWLHAQVSPDVQPLAGPAAAVVAAASIGLIALIPANNETQDKNQKPRERVTIQSINQLPTHQRTSQSARSRSPASAGTSATRTKENPPSEGIGAGPVKAGERNGYRYVDVRTGDDSKSKADDSGTCVSVSVGGQSGEEDPCS